MRLRRFSRHARGSVLLATIVLSVAAVVSGMALLSMITGNARTSEDLNSTVVCRTAAEAGCWTAYYRMLRDDANNSTYWRDKYKAGAPDVTPAYFPEKEGETADRARVDFKLLTKAEEPSLGDDEYIIEAHATKGKASYRARLRFTYKEGGGQGSEEGGGDTGNDKPNEYYFSRYAFFINRWSSDNGYFYKAYFNGPVHSNTKIQFYGPESRFYGKVTAVSGFNFVAGAGTHMFYKGWDSSADRVNMPSYNNIRTDLRKVAEAGPPELYISTKSPAYNELSTITNTKIAFVFDKGKGQSKAIITVTGQGKVKTSTEPVYGWKTEKYQATEPVYGWKTVIKTRQVPVYKTWTEKKPIYGWKEEKYKTTENVYGWKTTRELVRVPVYQTITERYIIGYRTTTRWVLVWQCWYMWWGTLCQTFSNQPADRVETYRNTKYGLAEQTVRTPIYGYRTRRVLVGYRWEWRTTRTWGVIGTRDVWKTRRVWGIIGYDTITRREQVGTRTETYETQEWGQIGTRTVWKTRKVWGQVGTKTTTSSETKTVTREYWLPTNGDGRLIWSEKKVDSLKGMLYGRVTVTTPDSSGPYAVNITDDLVYVDQDGNPAWWGFDESRSTGGTTTEDVHGNTYSYRPMNASGRVIATDKDGKVYRYEFNGINTDATNNVNSSSYYGKSVYFDSGYVHNPSSRNFFYGPNKAYNPKKSAVLGILVEGNLRWDASTPFNTLQHWAFYSSAGSYGADTSKKKGALLITGSLVQQQTGILGYIGSGYGYARSSQRMFDDRLVTDSPPPYWVELPESAQVNGGGSGGNGNGNGNGGGGGNGNGSTPVTVSRPVIYGAQVRN